jgi:signal peptidase II
MIYISLLLLTFDQLLKYLIPTLSTPIWIIPQKLGIQVSQNTGAAFSIPIPPFITIPVAMAVVIILIYAYSYQFNHHNLAKITTALIIAGTVGNLLDRLLLGYVIDYIKIFSWPTFNLADSYLTIGVILLVLFLDTIKLHIHH